MSNLNENRNNFKIIEASCLLDEAKSLRSRGYRFSHAFADQVEDGFELVYSFDNEEHLINLKVTIKEDEEVHSITFIYWTAFSVELDMAREYGIGFKYVDSKYISEFYRTEKLSMVSETIREDVELMTEEKDIYQMMYAVERLSGTCGFGNSLGYCMAAEKALSLKVPERAEYLRTMIQELSRIQSHLFWMAALSEYIGFDNMSMEYWKLRERIIDIFDNISGNRIMLSLCRVGGLKKDIEKEELEKIFEAMEELMAEEKKLADIFMEDGFVKRRLKGIGPIEEKVAEEFCVGPVARASGLYIDARTDEDARIYRELNFEPIIAKGGDCYGRCSVRLGEIVQSVELVRAIIENMPEGDIYTSVETFESGEGAVRIEQPEGQAYYYVKSSDSEFLKRFSMRTPGDVNLPALVKAMDDCEPADVPVLALTVEPGMKNLEW